MNKNKENSIEDEFSLQAKDALKEKIGDAIISFCSTWLFLGINVLFFLVWFLFDLYYDTLTLFVSLEAIVLAIFILINARVKEKSDRARAIKDYKIDLSVAQKIKNLEKELEEIKLKLGKEEGS